MIAIVTIRRKTIPMLPVFLYLITFVIVAIRCLRPVCGSSLLSQGVENESMNSYIQSDLCTGAWCDRVHQCIEEDNQFTMERYKDGI